MKTRDVIICASITLAVLLIFKLIVLGMYA